MKPIVHVPNPVLTTPAQTVDFFNRQLTKLIDEMTHSLLSATNPKGVGLAAPQIGEPYRIFITKHHPDAPIKIFINPEIIKLSVQMVDGVPDRKNGLEGCLSIPKIWGRVRRAKAITLRYQDEKRLWHETSFKGFEAVIVQHETDHINGILYTQRVLEQKGKLYQASKDKDGKEVLEEIVI